MLMGIAPSAALSLGGTYRDPNILDFADSGALGLKFKLFPVQRFVLKMVYGLELGSVEQEYLDRLQKEGRYTPAKNGSKESLIVMGRRSGMTVLGATVQLYESLKLLQDSEGWSSHTTRQALTLSPDKEQAGLAFDQYANAMEGFKLRPYLQRNTLTNIDFVDGERRIRAAFRTSRAIGLRGINASSVVFDNAAFWGEQDFRDCYVAVLPYLSRRTIFTSASDTRWFREFYYSKTRGDALTLRIPSWEANPLMGPHTLRFLNTHSFSAYQREFGAEV
jgi:hypothetical protein